MAYTEPPPDENCPPELVAKYLARYLTGGPISDRRLVSEENEFVTFQTRVGDKIGGSIVLFVFAIAANLCFCAAYAANLVLQLTPIPRHRVYPRWVLLVSGTMFASAIALYLLPGDGMGQRFSQPRINVYS